MYPEQPPAPVPGNNYDFIMNPAKPPKHSAFGKLGGDPFITKVAILVGGAVVVIIILAVIVNLFFGGKNNTESIVLVAQSEQEIVRLSAEGDGAVSQQIKNASLNTLLSVKSQQQTWLAFLSKHGRDLKKEELSLKKDASTDTKLKNAKQASTFDSTFGAIMRSQLEAYAATLKTTYNGSSNQQERSILANHYDQVQLLLKQWPPAS